MKVQNLVNERGNNTANQFVITDNGNVYFQSYTTLIAKVNNNGHVTLNESYWDYSRTTSKYLYQFLRRYTALKIDGKNDVLKYISEGKITEIPHDEFTR